MTNTEERVVNMRFNNADFKKAAVDTQKSLADVNKAVNAAGNTKGLLDLQNQMGQVGLAASKMQVITTTALATIASKATGVALNLAKSLTFDPVKQGFTEYESLLTKQNTIMNATGKSATEVKQYLNELNTYSDKTIYSFGDMTDSIQKFVNAGISLPESVKSIKGIANMAAFAGASSEEASRGMYAFSQSMGTGYIMLQDWMQIENANMGTVQFKNELLKAGEAAGTLTKKGDGWITKSGKFVSATKGWRDGLQEQWATTEVLNDALGKYTDQSTKLGRSAQQSAQEVRTFSAFMDTLKESIGSGWSAVFTGLFGGLGQATKMWTGMSLAIGNVVGKFFQFAAGSLRVWRNMGGAGKVLQGFKNILAPIGALLGTIGAAWREAFPRSGRGAGEGLYGLSVAFEAVTRPLQLLAKLITGATPFLATFFTVIKLGATVVGNVAGLIADFVESLLGLSEFKPGSSGILDFAKKIAAAISDAAAQVQKLLDKGASLKEAFGSVHLDMPSLPNMPSIPNMPNLSLPSFGGDKAASGLDKITGKMHDLTSATKEAGSASKDSASKGLFDFSAMLSGIGSFIVKMKDGIKGLFEKINWQDVVAAFNTAIFATMGYQLITVINTIKKAFKGIEQIANFKEGILDNVTNSVKAFQMQARAKLILSIALALLALAAALFILSLIPADKLAKSLVALGTMAFIMSKAMKSMTESITKMDGAKAGVKMIGISIAIMALAAAMILLALAMILFNHVDTKSVVKGLATMFVAMKLIESLGKLSADSYKNLLGGAIAIAAVAGAMVVLALALIMFKLVDWESMGKAGVALGGLTLAVGLLALIPYQGIAKVGAALLMAAVGMDAMALALIAFALVKWESIGKAAVTLGALAIALAVMMAAGGPTGAATIVAMGAAMVLLAGALLMLNDVEWASIGKLAVVFTVLSVALLAFTGIMYLMAPVVPVVLAFAGALALLGLGMLAFAGAMALAVSLGAAGVAAFAALATGAAVAVAVFLQTLAAEAPVMKDAFLAILQELINTIVEAVPMVIDGIKRLWAAIKAEFSGGAQKGKADSGKAGSDMVQSLGDKIKAKLPMIIQKAKEIIVGFLNGIKNKIPAIAAAGVEVLANLIKGIASRVGKLTDAAVDLIIAFAKGIGNGYSKILQAGVHLIADFLHKLADTIRSSSGLIGSGLTDVIDALRDVGVDMVKGIINGVTSQIGNALSAIGGLAQGMLDKAKSILHIHSPSKKFFDIGVNVTEGLAKGIAKTGGAAIVAVASMMTGTIATANEYLSAYLQDLDQKAENARGKADGLAAAAKRAADLAGKTKTKTDDKAANKLQKAADKADKKAKAAENAAEGAKAAQDRADEFEAASYSEKALIRSQDAQNQLDASKAAKAKAAQDRAEAAALEKQMKAAGVTAKQRKAMQKEADKLRADAKAQDQRATDFMTAAGNSAAAALKFQNLAGDELSKAFQDRFDEEAASDAEEAAYEKMSSSDKAAKRREQAAKLEKASQDALAQAKVLAYTDIEAANQKAEDALQLADQARQYLNEATSLDGKVTAEQAKAAGAAGGVVNLSPTEAAALAFNKYSDLYDAATAAAAGGGPVFNQYNTSPESLSPSEVYRQTNNLLTHAASNLQPAA